uniref:Uncharacterized protein n=1 Tax=viral metagenome TaxID=1070528 RepID=A0A6H1ZPK9_9ZZZZ
MTANEMMDNMVYDFMARFNWNLKEVNDIPFPAAFKLRELMAKEDRKAKNQQRELEAKSKGRRR